MPFPNYPHILQTTAHPSGPAQMSHTPVCEQFPGSPNPSQSLPSGYHSPLWHVSYSIVIVQGLLPVSSSKAQRLSDTGALAKWTGILSQIPQMWSLLHVGTSSTPAPCIRPPVPVLCRPALQGSVPRLPPGVRSGLHKISKAVWEMLVEAGPAPGPPPSHKGDFSPKRKHQLSFFLRFPSISPCNPLPNITLEYSLRTFWESHRKWHYFSTLKATLCTTAASQKLGLMHRSHFKTSLFTRAFKDIVT